MFTSKKGIGIERSLVNLLVGCMLLRYFINLLSFSSPCVQTIADMELISL